VQTEVSENTVAKLTPGMPAAVTLQAYQGHAYRGRLRQIFPSADRAKSIVEVRVTILDADVRVKPEMTASVTFQEPRAASGAADAAARSTAPIVVIPKRAVSEAGGQSRVWVVADGAASPRTVVLGAERLDQVEVKSGVAVGEQLILNPPAGLADGARVNVKGS
jgi:hypothetical protein